MGDIKFRVWEPMNQKMHYLDFALYEFSKGINSHKFVLPPNRQGFQNPYTMMNLEAVKVMQYTGLKDRNGREIYDGDIIQGKNRLFENQIIKQEVTFLNGCFMFGNWNAHEYFNKHQEIEVVGNVYEMPDWNF